MAKYFSQRDLDGTISYNNNDTGQKGTIRIGSTLVSIPGGTAATIMDARFNSDGVLVVKTDMGTHKGMDLQTHFIFGPRFGDCITEYNHSCSKPNSRLSDYNREVQAARQEREGTSGSSSSSSSSASSATAFGAGAAVGTGLIQGLVNRREKKQLEALQAEEEKRQKEEEWQQMQDEWEERDAQRQAEREEKKRIKKEQQKMKEQLILKQKEMEEYNRKVLLESMTAEERKAFLLQEREEKKKEEERKQQVAAEKERKAAEEKKRIAEEKETKKKKRLKFNLIFYSVLFGLIIILHLWFYLDDDFEWWQAALWGLLTLVVGAIALVIKLFKKIDDEYNEL